MSATQLALARYHPYFRNNHDIQIHEKKTFQMFTKKDSSPLEMQRPKSKCVPFLAARNEIYGVRVLVKVPENHIFSNIS